MPEGEVKRLNWGSGTEPPGDWINCDIKEAPGIDISCDIRDGLPLEDDSIDYAASIHAFPELPYPDVEPAMAELRRVLKPGGVLRLALPDIDEFGKFGDRSDPLQVGLLSGLCQPPL